MCFWIQLSDLLGVYMTNWTIVQRPQAGTDAHQYFCHSIVQSVYDTWVSCGSASRQLTVGCLIFSRWCLQSEGNREALVTTAGGELWVWEHFPWLKKKLWIWGSPTCECPGKSRGYPSRETLVSQGEFQISPSGPREGYSSTMQVSDVRTFPLVTIYPVSTWSKEWRSREGERRNLAEMDTSALPGRSPGPQQGRGKHWIGWIWDGADTWLTWTWETQSDGRWGMAARWCRRWGCSGEWVTTAPGEDEPVHLCICCGLSLCVPQKFHMMKPWFSWLW